MKHLSHFISGATVLILPDAPKFTVAGASSEFIKVFHSPLKSFVGKSYFDIFSKKNDMPDEAVTQNLKASLDYVMRNKEQHQLTLKHRYAHSENQPGEDTFSRILNKPVLNDEGEIVFIIQTLEDESIFTTPDTNDVSFKGSEEAYHFFMATPVVMGFVKGHDYVIEMANDKLLEVWGKNSDVIGQPLGQALPEFAHQGLIKQLDSVCITGEPLHLHEQPVYLSHDGKEEMMYIDFIYKPYYNNGSRDLAGGIILIGHDVTERVRTQQIIKEASEELQLAIEIAELGTFHVDLLNNISINSDKVNEWFGYTAQGVTREEGFSRIHPDDRSRVDAAIDATLNCEANSRHYLTYRIIHPVTGQLRHIRSFGKTLFNADGKPYLMIGIMQDITQQVLAHTKLEKSESELQKKVLKRTKELENINHELQLSNAALEQFAYAASHDLREPVRKVNYFTDRIKALMGETLDTEQSRLFERMENTVKRMNMLIDDLLIYSHISKDVIHHERVDLNRLVNTVIEDLEADIEEGKAEIILEELPTIIANRRQMQQLFQNLLTNALIYRKPTIPVIIKINSQLIKGDEAPRPLHLNPNKQYHLLCIEDNGQGFHSEDAEKIFTVFKRLHGGEVHKGTGIGLSIARKVVENHYGRIWANGIPGKGATFKILFPAW